MSKQRFFWIFLAGFSGCAAFADTVLLKDKATISGTILAEKHDQVVVDIGYTVLTIPRKEIQQISRSSSAGKSSATITEPQPTPEVAKPQPANPSPSPAPPAAASIEPHPGFYAAPNKAMPIRTVRDLVNQIGEAVVQVRTPSGLGSGFIINEDGFLMTNFHVIEGETQISVEVYHRAPDGTLERKTYKQVRIIAMNKFE